MTLGDDVDVHWEPLDIPGTGIKFLAGGHAVLPNSVFAQTLRDFVSAVVGRLDDMGIPGTTLHEQWLAIQQTNADSQEQEFCDAAARLGVDPYAIDSGLGAVIVNVSETIRPELLNDFLSLASIDSLDRQATALAGTANSIAEDSDPVDALKDVAQAMPRRSRCTGMPGKPAIASPRICETI